MKKEDSLTSVVALIFIFLISFLFFEIERVWEWILSVHIAMLATVSAILLPLVVAFIASNVQGLKDPYYSTTVVIIVESILTLVFIISTAAIVKKKWNLAE